MQWDSHLEVLFGLGIQDTRTCAALSLVRDADGALVLPSALATSGSSASALTSADAAESAGSTISVEVADVGSAGEEERVLLEHVLVQGQGSSAENDEGGGGAWEGAEGGDGSASLVEEEEAKEAERAKELEEEQLKLKAEEEEALQKAADDRKKEERKKMLDDQRRAVMAGMVAGPSKSGELSFFQKVPEKIKMLEINLSFLQSYMEETKKGNDESFEDFTSDVKALQEGLSALKVEVQGKHSQMSAIS